MGEFYFREGAVSPPHHLIFPSRRPSSSRPVPSHRLLILLWLLDNSLGLSVLFAVVHQSDSDSVIQIYRTNIQYEMPMKLLSTKKFGVIEFYSPISLGSTLRNEGYCICEGFLPNEKLAQLQKEMKVILKVLKESYVLDDDEFRLEPSLDDLGLVRLPRIGRGKHNIHFDPHLSSHHAYLAALVDFIQLPPLLSLCSGRICSLRETGFSLTRKATESNGSGVDYGEGMEWHSDGAEGEFTMLMGLYDVPMEMGPLKILPKSHLLYQDGVGHLNVSNYLRNKRLCSDVLLHVLCLC